MLLAFDFLFYCTFLKKFVANSLRIKIGHIIRASPDDASDFFF